MTLVFTEGLACVVIPFDHGRVLEPSIRHADREPPRAGKKFNTSHQEIPLFLF